MEEPFIWVGYILRRERGDPAQQTTLFVSNVLTVIQ